MEFNCQDIPKIMIKTCEKLIIFSIFFELLNLTNGDPCNPSSCPKSGTLVDISVQYPFRISDRQPNSCGIPGFDLHCDNIRGTLIQLQTDVVLRVEGIFYDSQKIFLSDVYDDCLPQKLMALNLSKTRFYPDGITKKFWLYNCSKDDNLFDYDQIECLSGSDSTVISTKTDMLMDGHSSTCKFVTILNVPVSSSYSVQLSEISTIYLNWDGSIVPPLPQGKDSKSGLSSVPPQMGLALCICGLLMIIIFGYCRYRRRRNEQATATITPNTITTTRATDIEGLDQVTIDSYPMVVIGVSGRLIKSDNKSCPICLSDYHPKETLKILPECLHRFHVECIDQWLSSKGVCPICRTSPPRISLHR